MAYYLLAHYTINDIDRFQNYPPAAMPITAGFGGKFLAVTGIGLQESTVIEGKPQHLATALLEFESEEAFRRWYYSPEYQAVIGMRLGSTDGWAVGLPGFQLPSDR